MMLPGNAVGDTVEKQFRQVCADLERRLHAGEDCHAEDLLATLPPALADGERVVELAYAEFVIREELGQRPSPAEWYGRFPQLRERLRRLFDLHQMLPDSAGSGTLELATVYHAAASENTSLRGGESWQDRYELLGKVGQGAMGVVYRARQVGLDRIVALKMIRAGADATPEDLARFRREAEAVARLRHPHIVQVYGIGEADGQPFFSLEFAEGGSLAQRIADGPVPVRQAAKWVAELAEAMEYAHREGIIHRDLKPANVVLTADGVPKITDFGLAKHLGRPAGHAESGPIVGTASYMAPEQAAGQTAAIGPPADVYALGAILYELLTGRPPFRAETPLETLRHVREREPERPRAVNPQADCALEAVCLKCLQKDPRLRYPSAQALADDLKRWLAGEPILARPEGWLKRLWRAGRRLGGWPSLATALVAGLAAAGAVGLALLLAGPRPTAEDLEAQQRQRRWRDIRNDLAAGRPVVLLGRTAAPAWYRWRTGGPSEKAFAAADGAFALESWELGLLEILPDPQCASYRFSAEVRHDQAKPWGRAGIYFAHSVQDTAGGPDHYFCGLSFNDLVDLSKYGQRENHLELNVERYPTREAKRRVLETTIRPLAAVPDPDRWRKLAVEVTPDGLRAFCGEECVGEAPREALRKRMAWLLGNEPANADPCLVPRSPLGLFISRGSASYRQVVVEPLHKGN
jgi:serine/threonine-protein kinase